MSKTQYPCIIVEILLNWLVELNVLATRSIDRQERKQLLGEWRKVSSMTLASLPVAQCSKA